MGRVFGFEGLAHGKRVWDLPRGGWIEASVSSGSARMALQMMPSQGRAGKVVLPLSAITFGGGFRTARSSKEPNTTMRAVPFSLGGAELPGFGRDEIACVRHRLREIGLYRKLGAEGVGEELGGAPVEGSVKRRTVMRTRRPPSPKSMAGMPSFVPLPSTIG